MRKVTTGNPCSDTKWYDLEKKEDIFDFKVIEQEPLRFTIEDRCGNRRSVSTDLLEDQVIKAGKCYRAQAYFISIKDRYYGRWKILRELKPMVT